MAGSLKTSLRDAALIVVSILIAFALDAWWDGQSRTAEEREALVALQSELTGSRTEMDSVLAFNRAQIKRIDRILVQEPDATFYRAFAGGMTFDPSLGAVEAILSGGLDRISNPELRAAIAAWPGVLREIEVDQRIMVDRFNELSDALVVQGVHVDVSRAIRSDPDSMPANQRAVVLDAVVVRQRLSALRTGVAGLVYELSDVEARLDVLETMVGTALANP